jgi:hypothetical protein
MSNSLYICCGVMMLTIFIFCPDARDLDSLGLLVLNVVAFGCHKTHNWV